MSAGEPIRRRRRFAMSGGGDASTTVATHISSLGVDVVLEIFLCLPSLASLVRAALTCRAWRRAVASSPDFRRRFRALHPAPALLGIFIDSVNDYGEEVYPPPCVPSFVPGGFRGWDLAGAIRGGDFLLTSLLERSGESCSPCPYWQILDCRGGRILLTDARDGGNPLIVLNPLIRSSAHEFRCPGSEQYTTSPRFISLDEEPHSSFRVALLAYGGSTLHPSVFSSDTGAWSDLPAVDVPARSAHAYGEAANASETMTISIEDQLKMHANGFVYWIYVWCGETIGVDGRYLISLDTTTMEFSFAKLPLCLRSNFTFHAGEAEDGAACIVYSDGYNYVGIVKHARGDDGVDRWVPDRVVHFGTGQHPWGDGGGVAGWDPDRVFRVELDEELTRINLEESLCNQLQLSVLAVRDGYVYFATLPMLHDPTSLCWFLTLCLATMKVEKLFQRRYDGHAFAYIMPWPPCLLASNYGQFAFEGVP